MNFRKNTGYYIGVLSGTSMDAVDVALCRVDTHNIELVSTLDFPFPQSIKKTLLEIIENRHIDLLTLGALDHELGMLFADAVNQLIESNAFPRAEITAIGSHGQTLFHAPHGKYPFTLALGNGQVIAEKTKLHTITDFRTRDILAGGQGAPLAPRFHDFVFQMRKHDYAVINIGGMSNISFLPTQKNQAILGFDIGPGNALLDYWIHDTQNKPFDKNGEFAKTGHVHAGLLNHFLSDPFFALPPPKSTGREYFNPLWLQKALQLFPSIAPADVQATLLALTATTIANVIKALPSVKTVAICGGGAKNQYLLETLQCFTETEVIPTDVCGVPADWMEAMLFAWLAHETWHKRPGNCMAVTGASKPCVLGAIHPAYEVVV